MVSGGRSQHPFSLGPIFIKRCASMDGHQLRLTEVGGGAIALVDRKLPRPLCVLRAWRLIAPRFWPIVGSNIQPITETLKRTCRCLRRNARFTIGFYLRPFQNQWGPNNLEGWPCSSKWQIGISVEKWNVQTEELFTRVGRRI